MQVRRTEFEFMPRKEVCSERAAVLGANTGFKAAIEFESNRDFMTPRKPGNVLLFMAVREPQLSLLAGVRQMLNAPEF